MSTVRERGTHAIKSFRSETSSILETDDGTGIKFSTRKRLLETLCGIRKQRIITEKQVCGRSRAFS